MKLVLKFAVFLLILVFFGVGQRAFAPISVGVDGSGVETFNTFPPAARWSTKSLAGADCLSTDSSGANRLAKLRRGVKLPLL